ncbi:MAG: acyl-CoA dehydrogenase family protein [Acidobacteriota bacterium]|nr:MAG: acyl-CoA dehydrogenase family protein [Acidobacteriota bacterium]
MPEISGIMSVIHGSSFIYEDRNPEEVFTREDISEEQRMFAAVADEFMRKEVLTRAEQIYSKDWSVTRELLLKAAELDLLRIDIPEEYGGLGLDKVSSAFVGEQIAVMPSFGASLGAHTTIGTLPIVYFGTPEQREKYLPKLATGEWIAAYCLTEPGSGSDALAAKTKAMLNEDGSGYILKGQKMWITNGGFADIFIIFAKVDGDKFTAFIVERGPGLVTGHEEKKLGLDGSSTTAVMLEDCFVPKENVLGEIGKGHVVAFNILNLGRLKLGSRNIGGAKVTLNHAIAYSKERHQFGRPISSFGLIKHKLAEMAIHCYVGDAIVWRTLGMIDTALENVDSKDPMQALKAIEQYAVECSIIKVWTSEALAAVTDETVQVYGGYGYSKDYPAERAYRDARITRIYEGTNEINRIIIPTRLLKGPARDHLPNLEEKLSDILDHTEIDVSTEGLTFAHRVMANLKETARLCLAVLRQHFGDRLSEEQESVALVADIVAEAYAIESALLRAEKMIANNSADANCEIVIDIVRTYANDAAERVARNARNLAAVIPDSNRLFRALERLALRRPIETISIRRRIADHLIEAGRYGW